MRRPPRLCCAQGPGPPRRRSRGSGKPGTGPAVAPQRDVGRLWSRRWLLGLKARLPVLHPKPVVGAGDAQGQGGGSPVSLRC